MVVGAREVRMEGLVVYLATARMQAHGGVNRERSHDGVLADDILRMTEEEESIDSGRADGTERHRLSEDQSWTGVKIAALDKSSLTGPQVFL